MDDSSENPLSGGEKRLQPSGVGPHSYTPEGVKKFVSPCRNGLPSDCPPFFSRGDLLQALLQFFHSFPPAEGIFMLCGAGQAGMDGSAFLVV